MNENLEVWNIISKQDSPSNFLWYVVDILTLVAGVEFGKRRWREMGDNFLYSKNNEVTSVISDITESRYGA